MIQIIGGDTMGFMKYLRFSKEARAIQNARMHTNSAGWTFFSSLPYADHWSAPKQQDWIMVKGEGESSLQYQGICCKGVRLLWKNRVTGEIRQPEEKTFTVDIDKPFRAGGRKCHQMRDLAMFRPQNDPSGHWAQDYYGRKAFCIFERFPCFDSYDLIHEDRYYRWIFLCKHGVLTRIYTTDNHIDQKVYITEDVAWLERDAWTEMEKANYLEWR